MCLKSITRVIENPTLDELVGFKVVFSHDGIIHPPYYKPDGDCENLSDYNLPVNEWIVAVEKTETTYHQEEYKTGFHIFITIEDAFHWGIVHGTHIIEVKYRLVTHHGIETLGNHVHIAREMYIPWPQTPVEIK